MHDYIDGAVSGLDKVALVFAIGVSLAAAAAVAARSQGDDKNTLASAGFVGFITGFIVYVLFKPIFLLFIVILVYLAVFRFGPGLVAVGREGTMSFKREWQIAIEANEIRDRLEHLESHRSEREHILRQINEAEESDEPQERIDEQVAWLRQQLDNLR